MDWKDPFGCRAKRRKEAEARVKERKARVDAAAERGRQRARDVAKAEGVPIRTPEQRKLDAQREARRAAQRRRDAIDDVQNQQPLTDSQMQTSMGIFDTGIVLDGGSKHEHQHQDPPNPPPPSYTSDSDSSSYDSGSSDSGSFGGSDS